MRMIIHDGSRVVDVVLVNPEALAPSTIEREETNPETGEVSIVSVSVPAWSPGDGLTALASEDAQIGWTVAGDRLEPPAPAPAGLDTRRAIARAECRRRILAVANETAQMNMAAWSSSLGRKANRTAQETQALNAFDAGVEWLAQMRARWPDIAAQSLDPGDDANWPPCPPAAAALAARF